MFQSYNPAYRSLSQQAFLPPIGPSFGPPPGWIPPPLPPTFMITKCPKECTTLVKVLRPTGAYFGYEYSHKKNNLIPHVCPCQPRVTEQSLQPLYSIDSVLFVSNTVTQHIEQYNYNFETDTFEQLEDTGLVYNPALASQSRLVTTLVGPGNEQVLIEKDQVGSLRKHILKNGRVQAAPPSRIITLMTKAIEKRELLCSEARKERLPEDDYSYEEDSDSETDSIQAEIDHDDYIETIPPLLWSTCPHAPNGAIIAFNYFKEVYEKFIYSDVTGGFTHLKCPCDFKTFEHDLIPKYIEYAKDKNCVIHVHNLFTNSMEKYVYYTTGFKQVNYPELVYNPDKANNSLVVLCVGGGTYPMIVLMRDSTGRFRKEQFCSEQSKYIPLSALPVKTLLVQRKEALKKKKEDKKKLRKVAQRTQEEVAMNPVDGATEAQNDTAQRAPVKAAKKNDSAPRASDIAEHAQRALETVNALKEAVIAYQRSFEDAQKVATQRSHEKVVEKEVIVVKPVDATKDAPRAPIVEPVHAPKQPTIEEYILQGVSKQETEDCHYMDNLFRTIKEIDDEIAQNKLEPFDDNIDKMVEAMQRLDPDYTANLAKSQKDRRATQLALEKTINELIAVYEKKIRSITKSWKVDKVRKVTPSTSANTDVDLKIDDLVKKRAYYLEKLRPITIEELCPALRPIPTDPLTRADEKVRKMIDDFVGQSQE